MVLQSIVTENAPEPERSALVISMILILVKVPRLFRDITHTLCAKPDALHADLQQIIRRARDLRLSLQVWHSTYIEPMAIHKDKVVDMSDGYCKIILLFYITSIYVNRLSTCIYSGEARDMDGLSAEELEDQAQEFAQSIISIAKGKAYLSMQSALLLAQKVPIAEATIGSGDQWKRELFLGRGKSNILKISERTFRYWCRLMGRRAS
jgi:hypothetical protein